MTGRLILGGAIVAALASAASAAPVVDGNLTDWGIVVASGNSPTAVGPNNAGDSGAPPYGLTNYTGILAIANQIGPARIEDSGDGPPDVGHVGPLDGGQRFDIELNAAVREGSTLTGGIMTGMRPGDADFSLGDIVFVVRDDALTFHYYALETTGRTFDITPEGHPTGSFAAGLMGHLYDLGTDGTHAQNNPAEGAVDFRDGIIPYGGAPKVQLDNHSVDLGLVSFAGGISGEHYMIEYSLNLGLLLHDGNDSLESISIAPSCGNDILTLVPTANLTLVPEPGTIALALAGVGAMVSGRRRARRA